MILKCRSGVIVSAVKTRANKLQTSKIKKTRQINVRQYKVRNQIEILSNFPRKYNESKSLVTFEELKWKNIQI